MIRRLILLLTPALSWAAITEVQAPKTNNYSGNTVAYTSNVTSGNLLVVSADVNNVNSQSVSGSGTGCGSTTWTKQGHAQQTLEQDLWTGVASATGPCTITVTPAVGGHNGIIVSEYSGQDPVTPIDTTGSNHGTGTTLTCTAGAATGRPGEWGYVSWSQGGSSSITAAGWTSELGNGYDGNLKQTNIASGTTASFSGGTFSGSLNVCNLITIQPPLSTVNHRVRQTWYRDLWCPAGLGNFLVTSLQLAYISIW